MNTKLLPIILFAFLLFIQQTDTITVHSPRFWPKSRPAHTINEVLPQRHLDRMMLADSVECYLLCENSKSGSRCGSLPPIDILAPYEIRKYGGKLNEDQTANLLATITNPESYIVHGLGVMNACLCTGHVAYVFTTFSEAFSCNRDPIAIIVCHDCSSIYVNGIGSRITLDIDQVASQFFLDLTMTFFPEDSLSIYFYERE